MGPPGLSEGVRDVAVIGAFFDIDGTLTSDNVWRGVMAFFTTRRERLWTHRGFLATHYPLVFLKPYLVSETTFRALWAQHLPWYFRGYDEAQMQVLAEWVAYEFVRRIERPDVLEVLRRHLERGEQVALVSGISQPIADAIARRWDVTHVIGSPVEQRSGRYTGRLAGPACLDTQKARYLQRYLAQNQLALDLTASYAYADSYSDMGLFDLVGRPVAVYPDQRLRALAIERGWPQVG